MAGTSLSVSRLYCYLVALTVMSRILLAGQKTAYAIQDASKHQSPNDPVAV